MRLPAVLLLLVALVRPVAAEVAAADGARLAAELGCAGCHAGLDVPTATRERAPDLGFAGLRYQPAYLLDYLRRPRAVRRHIGASRMPDFGLDEREALALTLFLAAQRAEPAAAPAPPGAARSAESADAPAESEEALRADLREHGCLSCHTWRGTGGIRGPELADSGARLEPEWLRRFLVAPDVWGVPDGVMPAVFWRPDAHGALVETVPGAGDTLRRIAAAIDALARDERRAHEARYAEARARHPDVDAAAGERVFRALNCAACHRAAGVEVRAGDAPDLGGEGVRVHEAWLRGYLAAPTPIRPAGGQPGSASRMPDFRLTPTEVDGLSTFLLGRTRGRELLRAAVADVAGNALEGPSRRRAEALLRDELACLGCHRLGDQGGRIGPDLGAVAARLEPAFVGAMVRDPQSLVPHAAMPKLPLPERTRDLVVRYLVQQPARAAEESRVLSPLDATLPVPGATPGAALYLRLCAGCHGTDGRGDGFNAPFLPVKATVHADASYLATRADDTLYDGIAVGAAILGRSHLMPAWGETLDGQQIRDLVAHLRTLCQCSAPAWSRDVVPGAPDPAHAAADASAGSAPALAAAASAAAAATTAPPAARAAFPPPRPPDAAPSTTFAEFVGAEACRECHVEQYELWAASTHGHAGGVPPDVALLAPFDGTPLRFADATVTPATTAQGKPFFTVAHDDGSSERFDVAAVVGGGHLVGGGTQSYFTRFPDGTLRFLPFDFIRDEKVWFAQRRSDLTWQPIDGSQTLADLANWPPTRILGNAPLANCDVCHGSQIQALPGKEGQVTTRFKSLAINCESCHGPGRLHVEWARSPDRDGNDEDFMQPLDLATRDTSLRVCFQCHASRPVLDPDYLPGRGFEDYFALKYQLLEDNPYFADGRIKTFSYQDNHQFSDCYVSGSMTCVDCHDPHSQKYRDVAGRKLDGRFADGQCTGCHASKAERSELHTHHAPGSPGDACTACHMPFLQEPTVGSTLRFARSDHTIAIPRPAFDASLPIDGACRQCHPERSVAELQAKTEEWWGPLKPHPQAVAGLLEAERVTGADEAAPLLLRPGERHAIGQFNGLARFARRFLAPDATPSADVIARLRALAASDDVDVSSLALASLHYAADRDDAVHAFLVDALGGLQERDRAVRLRWGAALRTLARARAAAGDAEGSAIAHRKLQEVLPFGVQSRLWAGRGHLK